MSAVHRDTDARNCGAHTTVIGQTNVYVNGKLASVEGDPETHGRGNLRSISAGTVFINGKKAIVISDTATSDNADHSPPETDPTVGSPNTNIY